jgi:RNA polymerase primary sigma factor
MVGLSKERVRQLKENALNKLREANVERLLNEAA